jgi:hypothetical protein
MTIESCDLRSDEQVSITHETGVPLAWFKESIRGTSIGDAFFPESEGGSFNKEEGNARDDSQV